MTPKTRLVRILAAAGALVAVASAAAPGWGAYVIKPGDTLWDLARTHHTTVKALEQQNGLTSDRIYAGHTLLIPGNGVPATAARMAAPMYTVKAGDTVTAIAHAHGTTTTAIAQLNHLSGSFTIYINEKLKLPAAPQVASGVFTAPPRSAAYAPGIAASAAKLAAGPAFSHAQIETLVRQEAARQKVPASLALAIAYQESGFSQRMVSSTNAVGVMQLMPGTASWLANYTGKSLDRYNIRDNIRGGVTLLRLLLQVATPADTAAGYYQGLASVRANGLYTDTKAYVRSVLALRARFS